PFAVRLFVKRRLAFSRGGCYGFHVLFFFPRLSLRGGPGFFFLRGGGFVVYRGGGCLSFFFLVRLQVFFMLAATVPSCAPASVAHFEQRKLAFRSKVINLPLR